MFTLYAFVSGHFLPTTSGKKDTHTYIHTKEGMKAVMLTVLLETAISVD